MKPTTLERSTSAQKENSILQLNVPAIAPHKGPISTAEPQHQPTPSRNNGKMHQQPQVQCSAVTNKQPSRVSQQPSVEIMHQPTPWINNQTHQQPLVQRMAITNKQRNRVSQQPSVEIMPQNQQSVMHQPTAVSPTELNKRQERELEEVKGKLMNKMKSTKTSAKTTLTKNPKKNTEAPTTITNTTVTTTKKKKATTDDIPTYSDDDSSMHNGVDYTLLENYAVKKIIGHKFIQKKRKGNTMHLYTRWKGWREASSITLEPLENMIKDWPDQVRQYCNKNGEVKLICKVYGAQFDDE